MDIRDFCEGLKALDSVEGRYLVPFLRGFRFGLIEKQGERGVWYSQIHPNQVGRVTRLVDRCGWFGLGIRVNGDLVAYRVEPGGKAIVLDSWICDEEYEAERRAVCDASGGFFGGPHAGDLILRENPRCAKGTMIGTLPPIVICDGDVEPGGFLQAVVGSPDHVIYKGTLGDFSELCGSLGLDAKRVLNECTGFPVEFPSWKWADKRGMWGFFSQEELGAVREVVRKRQMELRFEINEVVRGRVAMMQKQAD